MKPQHKVRAPRSPFLLAAVLCFIAQFGFSGAILFIGNSFTYGAAVDGTDRAEAAGGIPGIFDELARAGGFIDPLVVMRAVAGADLEYHYGASLNVIDSQQWDYVVIQGYSTEPTHLQDGYHSLTKFQSYGAALYEHIVAHSPQAKVILYETWSRAVGNPIINGQYSSGTFATTDQMQAEVRDNYTALANSINGSLTGTLPVTVAPVGDAWQSAGGLLPPGSPGFVDLFASDLYHGNDNGYYLAAAVFYSQIYRVSPHGLSESGAVAALHLNLTVDPTFLEDIAWQTVQAHLALPEGEVSLYLILGALITLSFRMRYMRPVSERCDIIRKTSIH